MATLSAVIGWPGQVGDLVVGGRWAGEEEPTLTALHGKSGLGFKITFREREREREREQL